MKFPEKIDKLLEDNGIKNLRKLAEEIEIPYTTLWDYYSNQIRLDKANLTYMKKIAKRLGCTLDYLSYDEIEDINGVATNNKDNKTEILLSAYNGLSDIDKEWVNNIVIERRKLIDKQEENKEN